mgnify:CR=1 FL=1
MQESSEPTQQPSPFTENKNTMNFYTVSANKFVILFMATFGLYSIYWFYKHWAEYKESSGENIWPIPRAIFSIFFTHSLFGLFEMKYEQKNGEPPKSTTSIATLFVVVALGSNIISSLVEHGHAPQFLIIASLLLLPVACWCLMQGQSLANYASDDVKGESNSKLTFVNHIWLALGGMFWLLYLLGLYAVMFGEVVT